MNLSVFKNALPWVLSVLTMTYAPFGFSSTNDHVRLQLQKALDNYRIKTGIPGIAMSFTFHDKNHAVHYSLTSGTTTLNGKTPIQKNTLFQVGSITKSLTAAVVLRTEADPKYKFNIDQPLSKWLPQYPQWGIITIRQLLNHTSGIYNYVESVSGGDISTKNKFSTQHWTAQELVSIAAKHPLYFKSGRGWHYSNTNYILAGMVVEAVTGQKIEQKMRELISIADLKNTYYKPDSYPSDLLSRMAHGYNAQNDDITRDNLSWARTAGALISTATDIDKWTSELLTPNALLPKKQLLEMQTVVFQDKKSTQAGAPTYGLGIARYKSIWFHDGGMAGYTAIFISSKSKHATVTVTANIANKKVENEFRPLMRSVSELLFGSTHALVVH